MKCQHNEKRKITTYNLFYVCFRVSLAKQELAVDLFQHQLGSFWTNGEAGAKRTESTVEM